jgi:nucleotide-binding universal stress UspA family protein
MAGRLAVAWISGPRRAAEKKEEAVAGIVVGVDGSPNSERALDWALAHAAALAAPLTVITVHEVAKSYWGDIPVVGPADQPIADKLQHAAEEMTQRGVSRLGDVKAPSVQVRALSGFVVKELIDASLDADMLVIGSRGRSGLARLVLGSVGHELVEHAKCPIVLVPHES